jgi:peptidoglycan/xylan/chitin deacetylase (PgdA/CDA1 family)
MRTKVCLTVDTEFSIGGAFTSDASRFPIADPMVWCDVNGRSHGLGFLLDCLRRHQLQATFFVEALHRYYFQDDPMRPVVRAISAGGHEIQLHEHPCWAVFQHPDWRERVRANPNQDDFHGRCEEDMLALINQGQEIFADWGLPPPKVFRSGGLQHDGTLYRALARAGIPYSSNIGLAIFDSGDPDYQLYSGCHERHGVKEFPVLTFNDWTLGKRRHLKSLTIAGTSFAEMCTLLERARQQEVPMVVILTHPFEYVQSKDKRFTRKRPHSVNQSRLRRLCEYLDLHRDRYETVGMASAIEGLALEDNRAQRNPLLRGVLWQSVARLATQLTYDRFGRWALNRS